MFTGDTVPASRSSGAAVASPMPASRAASAGASPTACSIESIATTRAWNNASGSDPCGLGIRCEDTISPSSVTNPAANLVPPMSTARAHCCSSNGAVVDGWGSVIVRRARR